MGAPTPAAHVNNSGGDKDRSGRKDMLEHNETQYGYKSRQMTAVVEGEKLFTDNEPVAKKQVTDDSVSIFV